MRWMLGAAAMALVMAAQAAAQKGFSVEGQTAESLGQWLNSGRHSSEAITRAYLARIAAMNRKGPSLRAVIAVNPNVIAEAQASDKRRKAGKPLGPLDGIPVLIKDNIETRDQPTTAGSLALAANDTHRDAPVVARLRAAGAVILGKTNLSEWANIRSNHSMSGWSAVGGLVRNPYALDRTSCGSSSGSGAAVAASFAPLALGTETDGSVVCPSSMNGLVGLKPTLGLVSRTFVVPISHSQDTPGPMAATVQDAAILLSAMAGSDPADPATKDADAQRTDYLAAMAGQSLKGKRVAYFRPRMGDGLSASFDAALKTLREAGAVPVEVKLPKLDGMGAAEFSVLMSELKADLNLYLAGTPAAVKARTLDDLIAFNKAHAGAELALFGQETFETAAKTKGLDDPEYKAAREKSAKMARDAIDGMLKEADADLLVTPTYGAAWLSDAVYGDQYDGPSASELPAVSGYPHLTVPMPQVQGLPVGLSFIGRPWSEAMLLGAGYDFQRGREQGRQLPAYRAHVAADLGPQKP